ncbi:MAG: flagellar biosynthetic protein FliO [Defluviitaleaceae bacterium]|nr:flagellar biosynthetic protein FliO [Defluviitaleaceae bacterium]
MENLIFLLSESWSSLAADQFFSMLAADIETTSPPSVMFEGGATNTFNMFWNALRFFGATILVAVLAWFVTKKMVGANRVGRKSGNLSVVESVNLGGMTTVQLVKAGEKYLVIGVTRERVTLLGEIDKEQIAEPDVTNFSHLNTPFGKVLSRFIKPQDTSGDDNNE